MSCPHCEKMKELARREALKAQTEHACCCRGNAAEKAHARGPTDAASRDRLFLVLSLAALVVGFTLAETRMHESIPLFPLTDPSWVAVVLCGFPIFQAAWHALLRERKVTSSLLISLAITASIALQLFVYFGSADFAAAHCGESYIFAAGEISFLMALGEAIEVRTIKKSREGIEALVRLSPKTAHRKAADGTEETVRVEALVAGDLVSVRPDDMVPADGVVVAGESSVNQAGLTGESVPVDKVPGDTVLAGTWNRSGALTVRVSTPNADNTISRLIRLVQEAEEKKAPIQNVADRWAAAIVPISVSCAVLVALFAFFVLEKDFYTALVRAVTVLVVFCPCAFALATPTAVAAGVGNATRRGILVKSGEALQKLVDIDTVAFDKTGTLTRAQLRIAAVFTVSERFSEARSLELAAAAESQSQHPIARAIVEAAGGKVLPKAEKITAKTGVGVVCEIGGRRIAVASFPSLEKENVAIPEPLKAFAETRRELGETLVCLSVDGVPEAAIALSDTLRESAPETVVALRRDGVNAVMLSGDHDAAARHTAKTAGITDVFSELLPEDKARKIAALRAEGRHVLMVGDGVNDAPALASADCSVAMGALGSEIAVETADIAFLNDNIALVPGLLRFSKIVLRTIHINFAISICINLTSVVLSALGVLDPVTGAIVHNASSVIVVSHSAALMLRKKEFSAGVSAVSPDAAASALPPKIVPVPAKN